MDLWSGELGNMVVLPWLGEEVEPGWLRTIG